VPALTNIATRLRIDSVRSTSEAGSGHPSTCCSAADIVAALFFAVMRYDPRNPADEDNDRFVLSKGHAAPLLYAAWAEAGIIAREDLLGLRRLESDLEGHPTPRLPWVDVATIRSAPSPTSTPLARAAKRNGSTTCRPTRPAGRRSAGTPSSSTATTCPRSSPRSSRHAASPASRR
jgi:hypothetical protein